MAHLCSHCGRPLESQTVERDLDLEETRLMEAAQFASYVPIPDRPFVTSSLIRDSRERAGTEPFIDFDRRDFIEEAIEEQVDAVFYIQAELVKHSRKAEDRNDEDLDRELMELRIALASVMSSYAALQRYRRAAE
jgi:hypothetical protein